MAEIIMQIQDWGQLIFKIECKIYQILVGQNWGTVDCIWCLSNDLTIGWQNLNLQSHPRQARQARPSSEISNWVLVWHPKVRSFDLRLLPTEHSSPPSPPASWCWSPVILCCWHQPGSEDSVQMLGSSSSWCFPQSSSSQMLESFLCCLVWEERIRN